MVIDPILNRTLVGSEQVAQQFPEFRNTASEPCPEGQERNNLGVCVPATASQSGFQKFLLGFQNVLQVLNNVTAGLVNSIVPNTLPQYNIKERKVLGMDAVTGTVVLTLGIVALVALVGLGGYLVVKKTQDQ